MHAKKPKPYVTQKNKTTINPKTENVTSGTPSLARNKNEVLA
jgi:hypothetical protein